ncbi:MAG: GSCFA domain-containing protein [Microscillaceae bacterium]|nr:GSCFA domain-containing protein [Microscillaceae bacterium]
MNLRTELTLSDFPFAIHHKHQLFCVGSCFADLLGHKFIENKFQVLSNPFGVIFNPISIFDLLLQSLQDQPIPNQKYFVQNQDTWYHYDFHSTLGDAAQELLHEKIIQCFQITHNFLQKTDYLILTLGTAWVYTLADENRIVSNCHKQPSHFFIKKLLTLTEIKESFSTLHQELLRLRPNLKILMTVSPVRHLKDSIPLNSVSKAILRLVAYELCQEYSESVFYFPAYELLMDDLRDYRFYEADMIHPNEVAEEYIWQKFGESIFLPKTKELLKKWGKLRRAMLHRPFHPQSQAHQGFLKRTLAELEDLRPDLDLTREIAEIKTQII